MVYLICEEKTTQYLSPKCIFWRYWWLHIFQWWCESFKVQ